MNFYTRKRRMPAIIIVSLIDIFVILLIFVIVTTTFKRAQPSVVIKLPESAGTATPPKAAEQQPPVVLTVSKEGEIFVDERPVPLESLVAALREVVASSQPLALRADTDAPFGMVIRVLDALKEAGVKGNLPAFTEIRKKG